MQCICREFFFFCHLQFFLLSEMYVYFNFKKSSVTPRAEQLEIVPKHQSLKPTVQNILADQVPTLYFTTARIYTQVNEELSKIELSWYSLSLSPSPWSLLHFWLSRVLLNHSYKV